MADWTTVFDARYSSSIVESADEPVGFVFGGYVDVAAGGSTPRVHLDEGVLGEPSEAIDRIVSRFVGRFVGLLAAADGVRVFSDPIGSLPVVYDEAHATVAASPLSLPDVDQADHFRRAFYDRVAETGETWLPGTTTYYRGVRRLLPNHSLNLDTGAVERYWPRVATDGREPSTVQDTIDRMATLLEETIAAVCNRYHAPAMSLTAGKDSRSLLAVGRERVTGGALPLYTFHGDEFRIDVDTARRVATDSDLDWRPLPVREATGDERDRFDELTGFAVNSAVKRIHPTMAELNADVRIEGLGGEVGRGHFWKAGDDARTTLRAEDLLDRLHRPAHPELVEDLDRWLAEFEPFDTLSTLDLAHQEHLYGGWGGPQHLGLPRGTDYISPYCSLPMFGLMRELPPDVRRFGELPIRIVERSWPALNRYPYNSTTVDGSGSTLRRHAAIARHAVTHPRKAVRHARIRYL